MCGVSYKEFCKLLPFDYQAVDREGLLRQLGIQMTLTESVLEEEGMHVFEWWGGEYHPLEELIAEMDEVKRKQKQRKAETGSFHSLMTEGTEDPEARKPSKYKGFGQKARRIRPLGRPPRLSSPSGDQTRQDSQNLGNTPFPRFFMSESL